MEANRIAVLNLHIRNDVHIDNVDFNNDDIRRYNSDISSEGSYSQHDQDLEDETMHSCDDCGVVFMDIHCLQRHVKQWCHVGQSVKRKAADNHEEESISKKLEPDNMDDYYDDDIEEHFRQMANEAIEKSEDIWNEKIEEFQQNGIPLKKSRANAYDYVFDIDKGEFVKTYTTLLKRLIPITESEIHKKIIAEIIDLWDIPLNKSIKKVLNTYSHWFNSLFPGGDDNDDSDDTDDVEDTEDESDD